MPTGPLQAFGCVFFVLGPALGFAFVFLLYGLLFGSSRTYARPPRGVVFWIGVAAVAVAAVLCFWLPFSGYLL